MENAVYVECTSYVGVCLQQQQQEPFWQVIDCGVDEHAQYALLFCYSLFYIKQQNVVGISNRLQIPVYLVLLVFRKFLVGHVHR